MGREGLFFRDGRCSGGAVSWSSVCSILLFVSVHSLSLNRPLGEPVGKLPDFGRTRAAQVRAHTGLVESGAQIAKSRHEERSDTPG